MELLEKMLTSFINENKLTFNNFDILFLKSKKQLALSVLSVP